MASCFSSLSRASSKGARSNGSSPRNSSTYGNETESGRYSDFGEGSRRTLGSFNDDIRARLSKTFKELKPTVMNASDMSFVNMSFLHRNPQPGSAPAQFVRRMSSINHLEVNPPQPTGNQGSNGLAQAYSVSRRYLEDAIVAEVDRDRHAPADLQSEEARLRQRLSRLRLDMLIMQGDGNCQFRAVSFGLYGTEGRHAEVRSRAISFMKRNPAAFAVFLGEDYAQYLDSMARLGTWGDELTLRALCEDYRMVINVIASTQAHWHLKYIPSRGAASREVFITYISPIHYNAIRRRTGFTPIRQSFKLTRSDSDVVSAYLKARNSRVLDAGAVV